MFNQNKTIVCAAGGERGGDVGAAGRGQRGAVLSEQGGRGMGPGSVPGQHRLPRA